MAGIPSNEIQYLLATKVIDFSGDVFTIILMQSGFVFDRDDHNTYADVLASELPNENHGYTQGAKNLSGVAVTRNDTDDKTKITWNNVQWIAGGGDIGPSAGAIIFDNTITTPVVDPIVGYIEFDNDRTQVDGGTFTIANPEVDIG